MNTNEEKTPNWGLIGGIGAGIALLAGLAIWLLTGNKEQEPAADPNAQLPSPVDDVPDNYIEAQEKYGPAVTEFVLKARIDIDKFRTEKPDLYAGKDDRTVAANVANWYIWNAYTRNPPTLTLAGKKFF